MLIAGVKFALSLTVKTVSRLETSIRLETFSPSSFSSITAKPLKLISSSATSAWSTSLKILLKLKPGKSSKIKSKRKLGKWDTISDKKLSFCSFYCCCCFDLLFDLLLSNSAYLVSPYSALRNYHASRKACPKFFSLSCADCFLSRTSSRAASSSCEFELRLTPREALPTRCSIEERD